MTNSGAVALDSAIRRAIVCCRRGELLDLSSAPRPVPASPDTTGGGHVLLLLAAAPPGRLGRAALRLLRRLRAALRGGLARRPSRSGRRARCPRARPARRRARAPCGARPARPSRGRSRRRSARPPARRSALGSLLVVRLVALGAARPAARPRSSVGLGLVALGSPARRRRLDSAAGSDASRVAAAALADLRDRRADGERVALLGHDLRACPRGRPRRSCWPCRSRSRRARRPA